MRLLVLVSLFLCSFGCVPTPVLIERPFVEPQYGMTKMAMLDLLGKPDSIEIYKKTDFSKVEFYIYHIQYQSSLTKVPVCLINNKVVGWGKSFYEDHVTSDDIRIK